MILRHSGCLGDILYSLPVVHAVSQRDVINLVLVTGARQTFTEPHPLKNVRLTQAWAENLKPLLEVQPYIQGVEIVDDSEYQEIYDNLPTMNLDNFRRMDIDPSTGPTQRWFLWTHAEHFDLSQPTLVVEPDPVWKDYWVVNRTLRNHNPMIDYRLLRDLPCVFVGLPDEYAALHKMLPHLEYAPVPDFHYLARIMSGARGFIGNQSFCFALAESLKIPRILEVPLRYANVYPMGGVSYEARTPLAWDSAIQNLTHHRSKLDYEKRIHLPTAFFHQQDESACSLYRATMPAHFLTQRLRSHVRCELSSMIALDNPWQSLTVQRVVKGTFLRVLERFQEQGKRFVWDTDDLFTDLPESNPAYRDITEEVKEHLLAIAEQADYITCTTPYLQDQLGLWCKQPGKIFVLPNLIDPSLYPTPPRPGSKLHTPRDPSKPLRILWAGSTSHEADLEQLEPVYEILRDRYGPDRLQWVFMGYQPTWACSFVRRPGDPVARLVSKRKDIGFQNAVNLVRYPSLICELEPDIAICPLADNNFNRCKSNIKLLEMTLAGACVVATGLEPYANLNHGYLEGVTLVHPGDTRAWVDALAWYIENPGMRDHHQQQAFQDLTQRYSWWSESATQPWVDFYKNLLQRS